MNSDNDDDGKSSVTIKMVESDDAAYKNELARLFSSRRLSIQLMQTILTANMQMVKINYTMSRPATLSSVCYVIDIAVQYPPSNSRMLARVYYRTRVPESSLLIC